jgi:hypothetical protein
VRWLRYGAPAHDAAAPPSGVRARGALYRIVARALAPPRGLVAGGVLVLTGLSAQVQLEWCASPLDPWDRDGAAESARSFAARTLDDADRAIARAFDALPEVDRIAVRVVAPGRPGRVVLAGTVTRDDALAARVQPTARLRLAMMGVRVRVPA